MDTGTCKPSHVRDFPHGEYDDSDLPDLLRWLKPDLVWFPAQWPETYSYTLSAALQAGLPVAVPNIGAFAERAAGRPWSWVYPWDSTSGQWVEYFFMLLRNKHFAIAQPPALPVAPPMLETTHWDYRSDYLKDISPAQVPRACPLHATALANYQAQPTSADAARSGALSALVYLRSLPSLRGVASTIPARWQRRVKSWLQT